jgi:hypothetical protein
MQFLEKMTGSSHLITIMDNLFVGRDLLIASLLLQVPLVQQVILQSMKRIFLEAENLFCCCCLEEIQPANIIT